MKKVLCLLLCIGMMLSFASCAWFGSTEPSTENTKPSTQSPTDVTEPSTSAPTVPSEPTENTAPTDPTAPSVPPLPSLPMLSISLPLIHELTKAPDQQEVFRYTFQDVALNLSDSAISKAVTLDLLQRMDSNAQTVAALEAQALKEYVSGSDWTPYYYEVIYTPTRLDQTVLSLSGLHSSYDGKSHPTNSTSSATYDLVSGKFLAVSDILSDSATAAETLSAALIAELDKIAATQSLFPDYQSIIRDSFSVDLNRYYNWYFTSEGICFYFSPFEIAPNSAGTVKVTVPYNNLTGILKDDYFPTERVFVDAGLSISWFDNEHLDLSKITHYSELISDPDARRLIVLAQFAAYDIRLEQGHWDAASNQFVSEACVFAANCIMESDALIIRSKLSDTTPTLRLSWIDNGKTLSCYLTKNHETGDFVVTPIQK